jgi:DNA-binding protein H-NS
MHHCTQFLNRFIAGPGAFPPPSLSFPQEAFKKAPALSSQASASRWPFSWARLVATTILVTRLERAMSLVAFRASAHSHTLFLTHNLQKIHSRDIHAHLPLKIIIAMTSDYRALLQQKADLEKKIDALIKHARTDAITEAKAMVQQYGLTKEDVFPSARVKPRQTGQRSVGEPKFRNPETGATWTGRGKPPKWIEGKDRASLAI